MTTAQHHTTEAVQRAAESVRNVKLAQALFGHVKSRVHGDERAEDLPIQNGDKSSVSVAIVGAGVSGLFAGYLLDQCGITNYKIYESTERTGGRVFTHYFSPPYDGENQYGDLGAMRLPVTHNVVKFLIQKLNLDDKKIKYIMDNECARILINGVLLTRKEASDPKNRNNLGYVKLIPRRTFIIGGKAGETLDEISPDPSHNVPRLPPVEKFPEDVILQLKPYAPEDIFQAFSSVPDLYDYIMLKVKQELLTLKTEQFLEQYDHWTMGDYITQRVVQLFGFYLREQPSGNDIAAIAQCVNDYSEVTDTATGEKFEGLVDMILDALDFDPEFPGNAQKANSQKSEEGFWYTLHGGLQQIPNGLATQIRHPKVSVNQSEYRISLNARVTSLHFQHAEQKVQVTFEKATEEEPNKLVYQKGIFSRVIVTTPFPSLRFIDIQPRVSYGKAQAMRSLSYDPSTKVFLQFENRFWEYGTDPQNVTGEGGTSKTDLSVGTVVYPSYGKQAKELGTLLASYTWTMDAMRMANMSDPDRLVHCLNNLKSIHGPLPNVLEMKSQIWTEAYALFKAGQFKNQCHFGMRPENRIHYAGEHLSTHHAWIQGAILSAARAVQEVLIAEHVFDEQAQQVLKEWADKSAWVLKTDDKDAQIPVLSRWGDMMRYVQKAAKADKKKE